MVLPICWMIKQPCSPQSREHCMEAAFTAYLGGVILDSSAEWAGGVVAIPSAAELRQMRRQ